MFTFTTTTVYSDIYLHSYLIVIVRDYIATMYVAV